VENVLEHERRPSTSFVAVVSRWPIVLLVALPLTLGAVLLAGSRAKQYQATSVVAFAPRTGEPIAGDTVLLLLPKYPTVIEADATLDGVASRLGIPKSEFENGLQVTIPAGSATMTIQVRMSDPVEAPRVANALAVETVVLARSDPVLTAQVAVYASGSTPVSGLLNTLIVLAAVIVGLVLGVLLALLAEHLWPRIRSTAEAADVAGLPVLGLVPRTRRLRNGTSEPLEPRADAEIATIWMGLLGDTAERNGPHACPVILVTSAARRAGVTTVAKLLAHNLARFGVPVLLVDANIEQPSTAVDDQPGLIELAEGSARLEDALHASRTTQLTVLPTRKLPAAADRIVRRFPGIVDELRTDYRAIVVDAPPLLESDLARVLCSDADRCLLVVPARQRASDVREAAAILALVGAAQPGIVLNRAGRRFRH
jgi:Mrp family chromosome partitioning ATPase